MEFHRKYQNILPPTWHRVFELSPGGGRHVYFEVVPGDTQEVVGAS